MKKGIIYISANNEPFEIHDLCSRNIANKGLPIISVTHKPMQLGKNICVGDIGRSEKNIFLQIQIGCENIDTDCIFWCESDTLYPPEHFLFNPENNSVWFNENIWRWHKGFYIKKKNPSVCSLVANREFLLKITNYYLKNHPNIKDWKIKHNAKVFCTFQPIVNIFHKKGMHKFLSGVSGKYTRNIQYWPKSTKLLKRK